jgi:hypothetical protein
MKKTIVIYLSDDKKNTHTIRLERNSRRVARLLQSMIKENRARILELQYV